MHHTPHLHFTHDAVYVFVIIKLNCNILECGCVNNLLIGIRTDRTCNIADWCGSIFVFMINHQLERYTQISGRSKSQLFLSRGVHLSAIDHLCLIILRRSHNRICIVYFDWICRLLLSRVCASPACLTRNETCLLLISTHLCTAQKCTILRIYKHTQRHRFHENTTHVSTMYIFLALFYCVVMVTTQYSTSQANRKPHTLFFLSAMLNRKLVVSPSSSATIFIINGVVINTKHISSSSRSHKRTPLWSRCCPHWTWGVHHQSRESSCDDADRRENTHKHTRLPSHVHSLLTTDNWGICAIPLDNMLCDVHHLAMGAVVWDVDGCTYTTPMMPTICGRREDEHLNERHLHL